MSSAMIEMLGEQLVSSSGEVKTSEVLAGKTVGLYFSAHWCPPCRGFTPQLAKFYTALKEKRSDFEFVFVSSDKDEGQWKEYFAEMPWLALPYELRDKKEELSKKFKVRGIPTLVMLTTDGEVITTDARSGVSEDPEGFPWVPPTFEDSMPAEVIDQEGKKVPTSSLDAKYLMLYFSAHWCPPCRGFTPKLSEVYKTLKGKRSDVECVFVSSDKDKDQWTEYFKEMPWMALPYEERSAKAKLSKVFNVDGIPSLVVLGPKGADGKREVINANARGAAEDVESFPWVPKPYEDLGRSADCCGSDINETAALVVLLDKVDSGEQQSAIAVVKELAEEAAAKRAKGAEPELLYFYATTSEGPPGRVRELCKVGDRTGAVILKLDIPDRGGYYLAAEGTSPTKEGLLGFLAAPGERQQLG